MANLRAIRSRIKSVENTRQITKSMKMVAAAKLRKTQAAFAGLRSYAEKSEDLLKEACGGLKGKIENPFLQLHGAVSTVCYVLIPGNRGLCGTYNHTLLRFLESLLASSEREAYVISCGRWGKDMIAAAGIEVKQLVEISDTPTHEEALALAEQLKQLYRDGTVDEIDLVYQHYRSALSQVPESKRLLPLELEQPKGEQEEKEIIFEPNRDILVNILLDMYIGNTVHAVLLEARTGEHSARMTAMTSAADNTEEVIKDLTLQLNHARQDAITTEISEIAGGAEALRNYSAGG